jgi:hypothetical protein
MSTMNCIRAVGFGAVITVSGVAAASRAQTQPAEPPPAFEVSLQSDQSTIDVSEPIRLRVNITNRTTDEVLAVGCLDGSHHGWRWPVVRITLRDSSGQIVSDKPGARCGNMDPLKSNDFVRLKPGQSFGPFRRAYDSFDGSFELSAPKTPGKYELTFTYDTRLETPSKSQRLHGDATPTAKLLAMVERVPKGEFTSNVLAIEVKARPAPAAEK